MPTWQFQANDTVSISRRFAPRDDSGVLGVVRRIGICCLQNILQLIKKHPVWGAFLFMD